MASATFDIGLSGLRVAQAALTTTSHNIANVNTDGYSRQRVTLENRPGQFQGYGFLGKGVDAQSVQRVANEFLIGQLRSATGNEAHASKLADLLDRIDAQLGEGRTSSSVQAFFDAISDANDDPRLMATRQVALASAQSIVDRFKEQDSELASLTRSVNGEIETSVGQINALTAAIAQVNGAINRAGASGFGAQPNDLLDQRDQLLEELARLVSVQVQPRSDGMVNVVIGSGPLAVVGDTAASFGTARNAFDGSRLEVTLNNGTSSVQVTPSIRGGELGALLEFREAALDSARAAIGRIAVSLGLAFNAQHRLGMDLNGALGGDLFTLPAPKASGLSTNAGAVSVAFDQANVANLTTSDYRLTHDGANFQLLRLSDDSVLSLSGAGPFAVDGMVITVTTPPAAGDEYLIQPTKYAARGFELAFSDPARLALAVPVRTARATSNVGDAAISRATVVDADAPALLATTELVFNDPPTTFQINGFGPLIPYGSGADIDLNGWRVQIAGSPAPGDTFTVESNFGGVGDNGNGLALGQLGTQALMIGGTATLQEAYAVLIGELGAKSQQTRVSRDAIATLRENAEARRDALSGVNLDEEAADLLRFQQAFQAAAQVIAAADTTFQALIGALRN